MNYHLIIFPRNYLFFTTSHSPLHSSLQQIHMRNLFRKTCENTSIPQKIPPKNACEVDATWSISLTHSLTHSCKVQVQVQIPSPEKAETASAPPQNSTPVPWSAEYPRFSRDSLACRRKERKEERERESEAWMNVVRGVVRGWLDSGRKGGFIVIQWVEGWRGRGMVDEWGGYEDIFNRWDE